MTSGILIGRMFGIEIRASRSWLIVLVLVTIVMSTSLSQAYADWSGATAVLVGSITSALFFGSVILHEVGHCLVARRFGIEARSISLNFFGGLSWLSRKAVRPFEEFCISISGPVVNILLGVLFLGIYLAVRESLDVVEAISVRLGFINLVLAAFNLIPGFPLDGGRVLRSVVWWMTKDYDRGTLAASVTGQVIAALLMMLGLAAVFSGQFEGLWIVLIGYYLFTRARASTGEVVLRRALDGLTVGNMWLDTLPQIERSATLTEFLRQMGPTEVSSGDPHYMVVDEGVIWGLLPTSRVMKVDSRMWDGTSVGDIMTPIDKVEKLSYSTDILRALEMLYESETAELPVVEENVVQGFVGRDSLLRFVASRMASGTSA